MKKIIILMLLVLGGHTAIVFGGPYVDYLLFHREISSVVLDHDAYKNEKDILRRVLQTAAEQSILVKTEDIHIDARFDEKHRVLSVGLNLFYDIHVTYLGSERVLSYEISVFTEAGHGRWAL